MKKYGDSAGSERSAKLHSNSKAEFVILVSQLRTSARFEGVGTKGEDVSGEAGLEKSGFIGRYSGSDSLGGGGHRSMSHNTVVTDCTVASRVCCSR